MFDLELNFFGVNALGISMPIIQEIIPLSIYTAINGCPDFLVHEPLSSFQISMPINLDVSFQKMVNNIN
jgi:hypothetical protein